MRVLGIDTATWRASVGLCESGQVVTEQSQLTTGNHAASLLPLIDTTLRSVGWSLASLDAVAVSGGPGSFTGLRVGLSVAKGLARAARLQLVAVPTLEALARTVADRHGVICALLDARKGELYAAVFESARSDWRCLQADSLLTLDALVERLPTPCTIVGDAIVRYGPSLHDCFGAAVTLLPFETYGPHGGVVAALGHARLAALGPAEIATLEPFYVRPSAATAKAA